MTTALTTRRHPHPHDDTPDTADALARLSDLPAGWQKDRLRQEVVGAWLPLARRLARRYRGRGEATEDLEQVAALGLVKAVNKYDPRRGVAFVSYAVPTIDGEIKRHFRDHMWSVHVPRRVQELRKRVRQAHRDLVGGRNGTPSVADVAARAGMTEEEAADGLEALDSYATLSLDAPIREGSEGTSSLGDTLGSPDARLETVIERESVKAGLRRLPEREKRILYLRFFQDRTQADIAREIGLSQMHVSRLISTTCARLRDDSGRRTGVEASGA